MYGSIAKRVYTESGSCINFLKSKENSALLKTSHIALSSACTIFHRTEQVLCSLHEVFSHPILWRAFYKKSLLHMKSTKYARDASKPQVSSRTSGLYWAREEAIHVWSKKYSVQSVCNMFILLRRTKKSDTIIFLYACEQ